MEKRVVQSLWLASLVMFAVAVGMGRFARPLAEPYVHIAGRGSAGLAALGLIFLFAFTLADRRSIR